MKNTCWCTKCACGQSFYPYLAGVVTVPTFCLLFVVTPAALAGESEAAPQPQLQELDLNYPEDGTSGDPRFRIGNSDDPEVIRYQKKIELEEARQRKLMADLEEQEKKMKDWRGGEKVAWPFAIITTAGGGVLAGFAVDRGWYSSDSGAQFLVIIGTAGAFAIAAAMLTMGLISSAKYHKHKQKRDEILNEIEGFPADEEDPYDGLAW